MTDYVNDPIADVVNAILADGVIDDAEVTQLKKRLYADGTIDKEEAEALFTINDGVKGKNNSPAWKTLFAEASVRFLAERRIVAGCCRYRRSGVVDRKTRRGR